MAEAQSAKATAETAQEGLEKRQAELQAEHVRMCDEAKASHAKKEKELAARLSEMTAEGVRQAEVVSHLMALGCILTWVYPPCCVQCRTGVLCVCQCSVCQFSIIMVQAAVQALQRILCDHPLAEVKKGPCCRC